MKQIYSDIIQFRGRHYDFGFRQGKLLKDSLMLKNRAKQWRVRKPRFRIDENEVKDVLLALAPGIWEELIGLQEALKWSIEDVLQNFGGYHLDYIKSGCSIFTGSDYMIRNYDFHPKTYEGRYALFQPTDQGYATIGPTQSVTGRMDGMNEQGLSIGYNFIHRKQPKPGFICNMIARIVLENCKNVDEALLMLREIPHRHSFSYVVFDDDQTFVVEATPRGIEVRHSNVCTNHFEVLTHENRHHLDDSFKRMDAIKRQENEITNGYEAFRMLNDTDKDVFSKNYKSSSGTIHTAAYFPQQMKAWFALGGDREPLIFDFEKWVQGEDILTKRILGELDTDLPFLHMD